MPWGAAPRGRGQGSGRAELATGNGAGEHPVLGLFISHSSPLVFFILTSSSPCLLLLFFLFLSSSSSPPLSFWSAFSLSSLGLHVLFPHYLHFLTSPPSPSPLICHHSPHFRAEGRGHSSLSSPQPATALPPARVDVPGVGQGCAPSSGHRGPHPCSPACPLQPVKTNGAEPTMSAHLSRGIQNPRPKGRLQGSQEGWEQRARVRLSPSVLYPITATGTPPEVSLEPKVPHGQGPSPQGCWPRGTWPYSEDWAGPGALGGSRPADGDHPAVTWGIPKQGVHCGPGIPALPLLWEWGWWPMRWPMECPRAAPVICGLSQNRTWWCCPSLPGIVTHPTGTGAHPGDPMLVPHPRRDSWHTDWTPCRGAWLP